MPIDVTTKPKPANAPDRTAVVNSGFGPSRTANTNAEISVRRKVMPYTLKGFEIFLLGLTPVSLHQRGRNNIGEYQSAPNIKLANVDASAA